MRIISGTAPGALRLAGRGLEDRSRRPRRGGPPTREPGTAGGPGAARPYKMRKPLEYQAKLPGDIVQVDTLDLRPLPGVVLKHFTARDVVSRRDVLEVHTRATAQAAARFLDAIQARMPFPVRAIQVDGGSEFQAEFEQACQERG